VLENAIHRSKHILTVSSYSKEAILKHFGIRQDKITVTPNGIIPALNNKNISLTKMGVYEPYFLYVGNAYPHKNLETMLEAFADFSEKIPYVQLVIAGRRDMFSKKLEKYAFFNAHIFRAPVANLMGLTDLLRRSSENEKKELIEALEKTIADMDETVEAMQNILKNED